MKGSRAVALSVLLVISSAMVGFGPGLAAGQSGGPIEYSYDDSPEVLVVDTSGLDTGTDFTVEYTTQDGPSTGTTVLARQTYNTANVDQELQFVNAGAYPSVNVTVSDYTGDEPKFSARSGSDSVNFAHTVVGTTGGDADLQCDLIERAASAVGPITQLDCTAQPGETTADVSGLDDSQTKVEIQRAAVASGAQFNITNTVTDNYLQDTETQAQIIGKNEYIRQLNNGSNQSYAKAQSKQAVADYYSKKKVNYVQAWNAIITTWHDLRQQSEIDTGVSNNFVALEDPNTDGSQLQGTDSVDIPDTLGTTAISLPNGSSVTGYKFQYQVFFNTDYDATYTVGPTVGGVKDFGDGFGPGPTHFRIQSTAESGAYTYVNFDSVGNRLDEIDSQSSTVETSIGTFVDSTYADYQNGQINNSDLVDPYVADARYSPSNSQTWAAAQLSMLGVGQPADFSNIGAFEISVQNGSNHTGVLLSQYSPASGQFDTNGTYDPANITGTQYVVTPNKTVELTKTFTIESIEDTDGEPVQNVTIERTSYDTATISDLEQQLNDLQKRYAELEAREQALKTAGGGGGFLGSSSADPTVVLVVVALVLALGFINN